MSYYKHHRFIIDFFLPLMSSNNNNLQGFDNFRIDVDKRILWVEDQPVDLPIKAVELLAALINESGEVVSKGTLLDEVWEDSFVEESVLTQNVYLLRKVFAKHGSSKELIQTIPRRGYRFTGELKELDGSRIPSGTTISGDQPEGRIRDEIPEENEALEPKVAPRIKNSSKPFWGIAMAGFLVLILGGVWWGIWKKPEDTIKSVAVLPLKLLTENDGTRSLSLGLTDNLINRLGSLNRFIVRPLSSVEEYGSTEKDAVQFGKKLKVDAVFSGTMQQVDNRLRINIRLIRIRDGSQVWEGKFSEAETDVLKLQDAISDQIAKSLITRLTEDESQKLKANPTQNAEAYEAFLKGRYFWTRRTEADLRKAITYYQKAIDLDRDFAEAYVGLADSQYLLFDYNWDNSPEYPREAKENLLRALSIKPKLASALVTLGYIRTTYDWDWQQAEVSFKRALEIEPNSSQATHRYGVLLIRLRRFSEAQELLSKARELDPLSVSINMNYGVSFFFAGKYGLGEKYLKETLEIDPKFTPARWYLARLYWAQDKKEEAVNEFVKALNDGGETEIALKMKENKGEPSEKIGVLYKEWRKKFDKNLTDAQNMAFSSSFLGDEDLTLSWLEKSVENRDAWAAWFYSQPEFEFVKDNPRFKKLMERMGFEKSS